jgi:hypothetical protein
MILIFELKMDGFRAVAHVGPEETRLMSCKRKRGQKPSTSLAYPHRLAHNATNGKECPECRTVNRIDGLYCKAYAAGFPNCAFGTIHTKERR